jgi:hypothetical protein
MHIRAGFGLLLLFYGAGHTEAKRRICEMSIVITKYMRL